MKHLEELLEKSASIVEGFLGCNLTDVRSHKLDEWSTFGSGLKKLELSGFKRHENVASALLFMPKEEVEIFVPSSIECKSHRDFSKISLLSYQDLHICIFGYHRELIMLYNKEQEKLFFETIKQIFKGDELRKEDWDGEPIPKYDLNWESIVLDSDIKNVIKTKIETFFDSLPILKQYNAKMRYGILLSGPPGTGKTLLGKIISAVYPYNFLLITSKDLEHDIPSYSIADIFKKAKHLAPCVLYFEDFDLIGESREVNKSSFIGELLTQMDGFSALDGVLTIANTNNVDSLDKALKDRPGRFDMIVRFEYPDAELREQLFKYFLGKVQYTGEYTKLVTASNKFSPAAIESAVSEAIKNTLIETKTAIITEEEVLKEIKNIKKNSVNVEIGFRSKTDEKK
jgi:SpoVK/Ycf46/Vps4 family AAA+-type ATPase